MPVNDENVEYASTTDKQHNQQPLPTQQKRWKKNLMIFLRLVFAIAIPVGGGLLMALFTQPNLFPWHNDLIKPDFNPPNWLFGPAWTVLYVLMGIASYMVWKSSDRTDRIYLAAMIMYGVQLVLNFIWTPIFFAGHELFWVLIHIWKMRAALIILMVLFF